MTLEDNLAALVKLLSEPQSLLPARLELSVVEGGVVVARVMADRVTVPLVGTGTDAPDAIRELIVAIQYAQRLGVPRRRRTRR